MTSDKKKGVFLAANRAFPAIFFVCWKDFASEKNADSVTDSERSENFLNCIEK